MNLALFDFDGTVTSSDTWTPFMRFAVRPARLLAGQVLLTPVVVGYRLGVEYATTVVPGTLRPSALERIEWHKSRGDDVVIVSASLDVYLGPWCAGRGMEYIWTTLEERGGRLTGRYVDGDCSGAEKARRILQRYQLIRYGHVYAYGDSAEDREMLELANKKYYRWREI
jgi:phosphatidylglycerophosphatase C